MTEYIHYFWVGFDSMGRFPLFRNAFIFLCCVVLVIVIRRLTASLRSGGSFFEAYRIAEGNFYIHGAIQFGLRTIPLKDIRSIQVHHIRDATDRAIDIWCIWNVKRGEQLRLSSERVQEIAV